MAEKLTSTEVVEVLVKANATGRLSVSGDDPVVVTGPVGDMRRASDVLLKYGLTCDSYLDRDEWMRL